MKIAPPAVDQCFGREFEMSSILETTASLIFITGIGGQGKSTVAAEYFNSISTSTSSGFDLCIWRDCKEEQERFENQLIAVVGRLANGAISSSDLAGQSNTAIVQLFLREVESKKTLLVFDNIDSYVDLEKKTTTGTLSLLVNAVLGSHTALRILFTCRPDVQYEAENVLSIKLEGLSIDATKALVHARNSTANELDIVEAHRVTKGHAFWLDLLAIQAQRRAPDVSLGDLVAEIEAGDAQLPQTTLNSIWNRRQSREK